MLLITKNLRYFDYFKTFCAGSVDDLGVNNLLRLFKETLLKILLLEYSKLLALLFLQK